MNQVAYDTDEENKTSSENHCPAGLKPLSPSPYKCYK